MTGVTGTVTELQRRRTDLASKLERANASISALQIEAQNFVGNIARIDAELARRLRPVLEPRLSDHALLRFLERVLKIDVKELRTRILTPTIIDAIKAGASAVTVEGVKFVVEDNVIVTTLGADQKLKPKHKARAQAVESDGLKEGLSEYYEAKTE